MFIFVLSMSDVVVMFVMSDSCVFYFLIGRGLCCLIVYLLLGVCIIFLFGRFRLVFLCWCFCLRCRVLIFGSRVVGLFFLVFRVCCVVV